MLGEHRELHGLWNIVSQGKRGYSRHPETIRWEGKLAALYARHRALVEEMERRGYRHNSPLDPALATGGSEQDVLITPVGEQRQLLSAKPCDCPLPYASAREPRTTANTPQTPKDS